MKNYTQYNKPVPVNVVLRDYRFIPAMALGKIIEPKPDLDKIKIFILVLPDEGEPFITNARYVYPV